MIASSVLCLTLAIYHEARSEPIEDQVGVAAVTMNRVGSKGFPNSVCGVVYSPRAFSWTAHKKLSKVRESLIKDPIEKKAFIKAKTIATLYLKGSIRNPVGHRKFFGKRKCCKTSYKPIRLTRHSKHIYY